MEVPKNSELLKGFRWASIGAAFVQEVGHTRATCFLLENVINCERSPFLKNKLNRFGFKVIELENNKKFEIAKNIKLNIIAADNCNPELCYKLTGCADLNATGGSQQIDSLSIIESKKNVLVNVNDCPSRLAQSAMEEINKQYNKIDVLLCGYQNASPYSQCFENLDTLNKEKSGKKISKECMDKALYFIKSLKPEYYLPFAGTYALTGRLSILNDFR